MPRRFLLLTMFLCFTGCRPVKLNHVQRAERIARPLKEVTLLMAASEPITNSIGMQLKRIPPGTVQTDSVSTENGQASSTDYVTVSQAYFLGIHEVTQAQYEQVMEINPSKFTGPQHPVDTVNWQDATEFCRRLSNLPAEKTAGRTYRLPFEAEWEFACRAGTATAYSFGNDPVQLGESAWYAANARQTSHTVGQKQSNPWGFFDLHGNVYEWCQDNLHGHQNPSSGAAFRGGSWRENELECRSGFYAYAVQTFSTSDLGFRVAADIPLAESPATDISDTLASKP